jgi:hypothetical protein
MIEVTDRLEQALDLWQSFAETQNAIVKEQGDINKDDPRMWQGYLHKWSNEEWRMVLEAVGELLTAHPTVFKRFQRDAFVKAVQTLLKYENSHDRCLDTKQHKHTAWKMAMTLRELWNQCHSYSIQPQAHKPSTLESYRALFD